MQCKDQERESERERERYIYRERYHCGLYVSVIEVLGHGLIFQTIRATLPYKLTYTHDYDIINGATES